jgi:hypothetical protein
VTARGDADGGTDGDTDGDEDGDGFDDEDNGGVDDGRVVLVVDAVHSVASTLITTLSFQAPPFHIA